MMTKKKQILKKRLRAYSLVEVSIVLLIMGIATAGVLKGMSLLKSVRLDAVVTDIRTIQFAYNQYINAYAAIPGNDKNITSVNKDAEPGKGDGVFCEEDAKRTFNHLQVAGLIKLEELNHPKIGSKYSIIKDGQHPFIKLDGLLEDQITLLITKLKATLGTTVEIKSDKTSVSIRLDN